MIVVKQMTADILIKGAAFFDGRRSRPEIDFIAVRENKIIGMGGEEQAGAFIGADTVVCEFSKDQMVMPGFHDNHIHLIQSGMLDKYADLTMASSEEEAAEMVLEFAKKITDEKWVMGFGWSRFAWKNKKFPTRESLDAVLSDRPVLLFDTELHAAWANSCAMEEAGITKDTADPPFGKIDRDKDGIPSGYFYETALSLLAKHAFQLEPHIVKDLIHRYSKRAVKWGITSVSDMTPYLGINLAFEDIFMELDRKGELMLRINAARDLYEDIEAVVALRRKAEESGTGMYRIPYFKQFLDGVISNHTAMMIEDYSDAKGNRGGSLLDLSNLKEAVKTAQENSMSVRLHACGDGAVRAALDAYEYAAGECAAGTSCRHQIEHIEVISFEDIKRFASLGVIASVQPEHIVSGMPSFSDNGYPELLGKERERYTWAFRCLKESGAILAGGSDSPVVEGNPFMGIYCGLERVHPDGTPKGGWNPDEKLTVPELLELYTFNAAFAEGREAELGTLEPGKLADMIAVDRNLLTVSAEELLCAEVLLTIVNGKVVYKYS
ncbi:amidohydrolase [Anoxybacterium hadale]|uniref:Amidohydrolase n=1 Tax=Anoxybacterium hadale TaxID=3408580 RepID=A0ACD1A8N1_9FIRM|nr:amidohydrolase [Clostridiales bacterium]